MPADRSRQRLVGRNRYVKALLAAGFAATALAAYEIIRINNCHHAKHWPKILDRGPAIAVVTTLFVAWVGRDQFARTTRPALHYRTRDATRQKLAGEGPCWQAYVLNNGAGRLEVESIGFHLRVKGDPTNRFARDLPALRDLLSGLNLAEPRDYWILHFTAGATLAPENKDVYFECTEGFLEVVDSIEAVFRFESMLGDRYEKSVMLLPGPDSARHPAPSQTNTVPGEGA
ncbi:MAG TPA: hypothetical protein VF519_07720 [Mycobacteriales bacterium]|jgi:hypothetical protein